MGKIIHREIVIPNDTRYLAQVRGVVREVVGESDFPTEEMSRVILAVDEAVTNIMEHAYEHDIEGELEIEMVLEADNTRFEVIIRDSGKSFDPNDVDDPDLEEHVKSGRRRGLGIFLIRRIMDEVHYDYRTGIRNELRLVKYARKKGNTEGAG